MNISAINPNFQGRRDNIDALITMDDNTVRKLAYLKTVEKVDDKKNRKITNALFYSAPIAAGLKAAFFNDGSATKLFSKNLTGRAAKAAAGLKVAALFTAGLGAIDLLGYGAKKLSDKSEAVRKFEDKHRLLSFGALLAAGLGTLSLLGRGLGAVASKKAPQFLQKGTERVAKFLNNSKNINKFSKTISGFTSKIPTSLKEIGATALDWSPTMLLFGGLFHSIASRNNHSREFAKNYTELRDRQARLTQSRVRELSMQNDFLMQEVQNREDMRIMKDNLADLPDEIIEKVETIQEEV